MSDDLRNLTDQALLKLAESPETTGKPQWWEQISFASGLLIFIIGVALTYASRGRHDVDVSFANLVATIGVFMFANAAMQGAHRARLLAEHTQRQLRAYLELRKREK